MIKVTLAATVQRCQVIVTNYFDFRESGISYYRNR